MALLKEKWPYWKKYNHEGGLWGFKRLDQAWCLCLQHADLDRELLAPSPAHVSWNIFVYQFIRKPVVCDYTLSASLRAQEGTKNKYSCTNIYILFFRNSST